MSRILKFIVDGQTLKQDPECDFDNLVPGSENYLKAEFSFSNEWKGMYKAAAFYSVMGKEYQPAILKDGRSCVIPTEALKNRAFKIQVGGKDANGEGIVTNKLTITQNGGNV